MAALYFTILIYKNYTLDELNFIHEWAESKQDGVVDGWLALESIQIVSKTIDSGLIHLNVFVKACMLECSLSF